MRKGKTPKRAIKPDLRYQDVVLTKFGNALMKEGKKEKALKILYGAIDIITQKTQKNGHEIFKEALSKVAPTVELKRRRVKGANMLIPVEARPERQRYLSIKWLIQGASKRPDKTMQERLALEVIAAAQGEGKAIQQKNEVTKMAESNRAFAHLK